MCRDYFSFTVLPEVGSPRAHLCELDSQELDGNAETAGARLKFRCPQLVGPSGSRGGQNRAGPGRGAPQPPSTAAGTRGRCAASADLTRPKIRTLMVRIQPVAQKRVFTRTSTTRNPDHRRHQCLFLLSSRFYCSHVKTATLVSFGLVCSFTFSLFEQRLNRMFWSRSPVRVVPP